MSEESERIDELQASELEREERRLERLRLIVNAWSVPGHVDDVDPGPKEAA
jgi:hypothetical protein